MRERFIASHISHILVQRFVSRQSWNLPREGEWFCWNSAQMSPIAPMEDNRFTTQKLRMSPTYANIKERLSSLQFHVHLVGIFTLFTHNWYVICVVLMGRNIMGYHVKYHSCVYANGTTHLWFGKQYNVLVTPLFVWQKGELTSRPRVIDGVVTVVVLKRPVIKVVWSFRRFQTYPSNHGRIKSVQGVTAVRLQQLS